MYRPGPADILLVLLVLLVLFRYIDHPEIKSSMVLMLGAELVSFGLTSVQGFGRPPGGGLWQ